MTESASNICRELARRFPTSAAASGGAPLRISVDKVFPTNVRARPDEKESFLEAAEYLQGEGVVSLSWKRFREGEELSGITLTDPQSLYSRLGQPYPLDVAVAARAVARLAASEGSARHDPVSANSFFTWLSENIRPADTVTKSEAGRNSLPLAETLGDLARLLKVLPSCARDGMLCGVTLRALSIRLFSDSKRIEALLRDAAPLLARARRADVPVPDLGPLERTYPETLVSGPIAFGLDDGSTMTNPSGLPLGIPLFTAGRILGVGLVQHAADRGVRRLLTIENLETFYALAADRYMALADAFLYTGGHPNRAVQLVLAAFARSGFSLFHAGDLDPDGILILQELSDFAGSMILPLKMDASTFDEHAAHARELDSSSLSRTAIIRDDTRAIPGIEELLQRILSSGKGVEQEIIEY